VKLAAFHPKARNTIRSFPTDVRREPGKAIFDLQAGGEAHNAFVSVDGVSGGGRSRVAYSRPSGIYRVFYYTKLADTILIFHAFAKKTEKTPQHEIFLEQQRLKEILDEES
jgi:phage-related protein